MPRTTLDRVGNNIKGFSGWVFVEMKTHNLTQGEVAKYLGITQGNFSQKLSGKIAWSLKDAFQLFELFGNSYEWR